MTQTVTPSNVFNAQIFADNESGEPTDISGSANNAKLGFKRQIDSAYTFDADYPTPVDLRKDASLELSVMYTRDDNEGRALLEDWYESGGMRTLSIYVEDDLYYSAEWHLQQLDIPLAAGDANPVVVTAQFLSAGTQAQMFVYGNSIVITNGDILPDIADGTDFGEGGLGSPVTHSFAIRNVGSTVLEDLLVTAPAGYTVTIQPSSSVLPGHLTTFSIRFNAESASTFAGTVIITSNAETYTFAISADVTYAATILYFTPLIWLRCDETVGTTAEDSSSNNYDGTISGSPALGQTGLSAETGTSFLFDGDDSRIQIPNNAALQALGAFTFAFLGNPLTIGKSNQGALFVFGNADVTEHFLIHTPGLRLFFVVRHTGGNMLAETVDNAVLLNTPAWYFAVYDPSTKTGKIYRGNGGALTTLALGTNTAGPGTAISQTNLLNVGNVSTTAFTYDGYIDEALVFPSMLTVQQMTDIVLLTGI